MSDPFVGEIRMFAGSFAPRGWALCQGQLLAISQNDALFSLLGTIYGGDGRTTFGLPDMRGRVPVHQGQGPGLSNRRIGARGGVENATVTANQMPAHTHAHAVTPAPGISAAPAPSLNAARSRFGNAYSSSGGNVALRSESIDARGGSQSHNNEQPYLVLNFIIALFGIYPPRS